MGSCVSSSSSSSLNKSSSASDSVVTLAAFISLPPYSSSTLNSNLITSSTINAIHSLPLHSSGDKEEIIFFDSRGWLDSDCEEDFMSVDGGTTPVHHKLDDQTPQGEEDTHKEEEEEEEPSPTDNKKRLIELFKETQDDEEEHYVAQGKSRAACLWLRTPVRSSAPPKRVRSAAHGSCVPSLVSCSSFTDRRRHI